MKPFNCLFLIAAAVFQVQAEGLDNLVYAHAHNDYVHKRPLLDALDHQFYSVEADVYFEEDKIIVTHDLPDYEALLQQDYLDVLQKRVDEKGSVHGDGKTFYLWVDVKRRGADLKAALIKVLDQYPMLTTFTDGAINQGPVTVVLTGDAQFKEDYVKAPARKACRDSNNYSLDDPKADNGWMWYALSWRSHFKWRGKGPLSDDERETLHALVKDIHSKGRKVRFYAAPDIPPYWRAAVEAGVDLINTDLIPDLHQFLKDYKAK